MSCIFVFRQRRVWLSSLFANSTFVATITWRHLQLRVQCIITAVSTSRVLVPTSNIACINTHPLSLICVSVCMWYNMCIRGRSNFELAADVCNWSWFHLPSLIIRYNKLCWIYSKLWINSVCFYRRTVHSVVYLITHTKTCIYIYIYIHIYILFKKSKIYGKTFKMLLHVSITRSSSGSIHCSLLKL